ncbi:carbohydrate kinase family protein [Allonocardiopsis opalescens]|uniref:Sugar/nucleoside kinase (Ribokinase family) n=1 Tax=Allonocardiopsis opalescens TaxID=1144618 RepID=A0A2T0QAI6_9ACTN|nr:PfkB family carbohydrate kinase [Allonocardiopsis opalescens]PRY00821.1 sugar/nucleoside kinase (ribokinase family) [Allonocardiopsis opalescens]
MTASAPVPGTVVTLGAHIVDVLARPVEAIPDGQDTHVVEQIRVTAAGAAAATAVDLVRLGLPVETAGAIGDDELGDFLLAMLARRGVGTRHLVRRSDAQTSASVLPIRADGGRPSFHAPGANLTVQTADVDPALLRSAAAVHLGGPDVTFGLNEPGFLALLDEVRAGGTIVTMDLLSNLPDLVAATASFLPHIDYLLPNEEQARALAGTGDTAAAAAALLAAGPAGVAVTLGAEGSLLATADGQHHVPALPVEVVDTTGCGDAYSAGFLAGLLHGRPPLTAAHWGTAAAAATATGLGSDAGLTDLPTALRPLDPAHR